MYSRDAESTLACSQSEPEAFAKPGNRVELQLQAVLFCQWSDDRRVEPFGGFQERRKLHEVALEPAGEDLSLLL